MQLCVCVFQSLPCQSLSSAITYNRRHIGPNYYYKQEKCQYYFENYGCNAIQVANTARNDDFNNQFMPFCYQFMWSLTPQSQPLISKSHVCSGISRELVARFRKRHERAFELYTKILYKNTLQHILNVWFKN